MRLADLSRRGEKLVGRWRLFPTLPRIETDDASVHIEQRRRAQEKGAEQEDDTRFELVELRVTKHAGHVNQICESRESQ